jgi:hypothetical protein
MSVQLHDVFAARLGVVRIGGTHGELVATVFEILMLVGADILYARRRRALGTCACLGNNALPTNERAADFIEVLSMGQKEKSASR